MSGFKELIVEREKEMKRYLQASMEGDEEIGIEGIEGRKGRVTQRQSQSRSCSVPV
jgi:hypothetical protein